MLPCTLLSIGIALGAVTVPDVNQLVITAAVWYVKLALSGDEFAHLVHDDVENLDDAIFDMLLDLADPPCDVYTMTLLHEEADEITKRVIPLVGDSIAVH